MVMVPMCLLLSRRWWSPGTTAAAAGTHREGDWDAGCAGRTTGGERMALEIRGGRGALPVRALMNCMTV
jgi:hypothetical protein